MQTFLPYSDFAETARCLDRQRLGKQRVEALQILQTLTNPNALGWKHHPACKMWSGREHSLQEYGIAICREWLGRGYHDTCLTKIKEFSKTEAVQKSLDKKPNWLGFEAFHLSHRSKLIQKYPEYYLPLWPDVPNDLEYVWPAGNES